MFVFVYIGNGESKAKGEVWETSTCNVEGQLSA